MAFHCEQIGHGNKIIDKFTQEQPFTILLAQMQSGKTGTYLFTAFEMVRLGLVKNVVVICGSSDTSLREQAKTDLHKALKGFQRETLVNGDGEGGLHLIDAEIDVFFSQDLAKLDEIKEETLIIHEESHMAQSKNNIPFKRFYQKNNLDKALMGDFTELKEKRCYILGISATPFSEIVANKKVQTNDWTSEETSALDNVNLDAKNFYFMQPGSGYIGVSDFLESGAIKFEAENIKADDCVHISSVIRKGSAKYHQKYIVVRTQCAEKDEDMMRTIASTCSVDYKSVFGGSGSTLDFMNTQPLKTTLVHICGRFRMGQVVPKIHIAMVYEQSKNPNADTILQGLLGRVCGYRASGSHTDVDIFISAKSEGLVRKYHEAWSLGEMDVLSQVTQAMNLGGVKQNNGRIVEDKDGVKHIKTVPIKFPISLIERGFGETVAPFKKIDANNLRNMFEDHPELIQDNPDKEEILKLLGLGRKTHHNGAFLSSESSQIKSRKYFEELENAEAGQKRLNVSSYSQSVGKRTTAEFEKAPLSLFGSNRGTKGNEEGICYLMGFVRYNPDIHGLDTEEIATVDPKCNYVPGIISMEDDSILDNVNGGQIITISIDTADDPESLEGELRKAILRTIEGHSSYIPSCTRAIHSLFDKETRLYEGIRLDRATYTEERIEEIKESLNRELSVNLKFKKSRGRQPKDQIKYASISW